MPLDRGLTQRMSTLADSLPTTRQALASLRSTDPLLLVSRLTLIIALPLFEIRPLRLFLVVAAVVAVALLTPALLRWGWFFVALAAGRFLWKVGFWELVDNHEWLITWWTLAVGCCLLTSTPRRSLQHSAALLIGLTFAFATFWKLAGGAFLDGRFFEFTLLTDERLENFAERFAALGEGHISSARSDFDGLQNATGPPEPLVLGSSSELRFIGTVMGWWGLAIEGAIAVLYLVRSRARWVVSARVWAVVAFCATTYLLLPVIYFAAALLTMAIAASPARYTRVLLLLLALVVAWTAFVILWGLPL